MATKHSKTIEFELTPWEDAAAQNTLRSAFRSKHSWVVNSPQSTALWYLTVLSNLTGRYLTTEPAGIETVRTILNQGLSNRAFERLKQIAAVSNEELGQAISIPMRTLARRKIFKLDESERLLRVASVFQKALDVFGDLQAARRWFTTPKRALEEKAPLEYCNTGPGAEVVEHLLGRIEHGVFT